jgi:hypothetical protein
MRSSPPVKAKLACRVHADCPNDGVCFEGRCEATVSCLERKNCRTVPVCADQRCICSANNRCLPVCATDEDCAIDGMCIDGVCETAPAREGHPPELVARSRFSVGLGQVDLDYPVGVSLAGYEGRVGPTTPYQASLGGSNAWFGRPDARAIAFGDGAELFVILRLPTCWSTDEISAAVIAKVAERTGVDLEGRLVTSAMHSHALPGRYWHMLVGYHFGIFGYDEFDFAIFDRLTGAFADAVIMALETMQPASFGYTIIDGFDPSDLITRSRRIENQRLPGYLPKDDRMIVMRIDDDAGRPLAALAGFGIHGTIFDGTNPMVTADAPGAVEVELTLGASEIWDRPVLGIFLQGNAGDIAPAADELGHSRIEQMQLVGKRAFAVIGPALESIETKAEVPLSIASARFPISRSTLDYAPGTFFDRNTGCDDSPSYFRYGAFQCAGGMKDADPATMYVDGDLQCVFSVECLTDGYPIPQFMKTQLSVMSLGDLVLATMPGEPLTMFGRRLEDRLLAAVPGARAAHVLGYSQDHHFYLLEPEDWFQGGYEPSMDIWGWKLAPYLADRSIDLAQVLAVAPDDRMIGSARLKPSMLTAPLDASAVAITETEGPPEEIRENVAPAIERFEKATFVWRGGDPGIDRPRVYLEEDRGSGFETRKRAGGRDYDDSFFEMIVSYEGKCTSDQCSDHAWRVVWDERRDFPIGQYRFRVEGRAKRNGAIASYRTWSSAFALVPSTRLAIGRLAVAGGRIEGRITDPPAIAYVAAGAGRTMKSTAQLLRSTLAPAELGVPLPESAMLDVRGTIASIAREGGIVTSTLSGRVGVTLVHEPRTLVTGFDAQGAPIVKDVGVAPTTKFSIPIDVSDLTPRGVVRIAIALEDDALNSGTATATIAFSP